jgi:hypothetical protein
MADAEPKHPATWKVVRTDEFRQWAAGLDGERRAQVEGAIGRVESVGPLLGRPRVDSIQRSRLHNLKELRIHDGVRILFAFDPNRRAVMLVGGNKTGRWDRWYDKFIPVAEGLYGKHLRSIGKEDPCLTRPRTATNSAARSR